MALRNPTYNLPKGGIGYRRLLSETEFLKVKQRARVLQKYGTDIDSVYVENQTVMFKTRSAEYDGNKITYTQRVYIEEASFENVVKARNFNELERIMRDGGLKVHCNCPAFTFWGYKYKAWNMGYGLEREFRRPIIRNPHNRGYVCKHLYLVLEVFPFISNTLASRFKEHWQQQLKK